MTEETIPVNAYELYIRGIQAIQQQHNLTLEEAVDLVKNQAIEVKGTEHLPFIEAAYQYLLNTQDS